MIGTQAVSFGLDLTERRRSEEALQPAHTELAHHLREGPRGAGVDRTRGQPAGGPIVAEADACRNWLAKPDRPPELVREAWTPGHRAR